MQKFLRTLTLVALLAVPWVTQAQNAKVSEYDVSASTATYSSIAGTTGATAWTAADKTAGYVDVSMPFAMYFGETQVPANSTLRVYGNGSATFESVTGLAASRLAPLYYAAGYTTTATSVYTKTSASMVTVEWRKVTQGGENSYSFQLKLYSTGDVEFCYGPMTLGSTINVFTGLMSADNDVCRVRGEGGTLFWNTVERALDYATRSLSSNYHPEYDANTHQGVVYTFTQPACVKPTGITAEATAWNTIAATWTVSSNGTGYQVKYSTNADFNPNTEGTVKNVNGATTLTTDLTGLTANTTYYIYVRKNCSGTYSGWTGPASATTPSGCPTLSGIASTNVTATGATLYWTTSVAATSFDVRYNLGADFDPAEGEGTLVTTTDTSKALTGLTGASTYYYHVRANCVSGLTTDWYGPYTFNTACGAQNVPYTQNFEGTSMPSCWTEEVISGDDTWQFSSGYASFIYTPNASSRLVSPAFNLSTTGAYQVEFNHAEMDYQGTCDSLWLYYRTSATAEWVRLGQYGNHSSSFAHEVVLLPNPTATYQLAFVSYGMDGNRIYLANVVVRTQPTCPTPSALAVTEVNGNSVTLSWTENGTATAWQIAYGLFTTEEDYTIVNATTNPFTVSGLGLGLWRFYVRSVCGAGDTSDWFGYAEQNFGYCTPAPTSVDNQGMTNVTFGNTLVVNDNNTTSSSTTYQNHSDMVGDLFAGAESEVSITYKTGYTYGTKIWIDFNNDLDFDDDGELVYTGLSASNNPTTLVATFTIPAGTALGDYRMRIGGTDNDSGPDPCYSSTYGCLRDYTVRVVAAPSCFKPSNLAASNVTTTEATLTWVEAGLSTQWEVKYGPAGFNIAEGEGISVIVNTTPSLILNYLDMGVAYDAYVRAICDPEGPTEWLGPVSFTTQYTSCLAYGAPGAEQTVTIGTGTSTNTYLPSYSYYNYSLTQQIYTAEEIGGSGIINSIALNFNAKKDRTVDIYLVETEKSSFSSGTDWVAVTAADKVYTGALCSTTGWITYELTTPFNYSGNGNLLLVIDDNTGSWVSGLSAYVSDATGQALRVYSDGTNYDPTNNPSYSGTVMNVKNNIQLGIQYAQCISYPVYAPQTAIALSETEYAATLTFTNMNEGETNPTYGIIWGPQGFNPKTAGTSVSPITTSTYIISNLAARTTYDVYVYAIASDNRKSDTVRYAFTTDFIPNCKTPNTIAASNITYNTADLTWNQPGDMPQTWTVRYADADFDPLTAAATDYTEMTITGSTTPAAQLTGLVAGTTYYIYIKATCATAPDLDESPWSKVTNANPAYTFSTPVCVTPTAVAASDVTNSTAMIRWTSNGTAWTVKYGLAGFDPDNEGIAVASTADSLELTGLDPYANYEVYVKSNCTATDESGWSAVCAFRTACPDGGSATIGDGTGTTTGVPVANYGSTYCQQIFTAEELREAGVANNIAGLAFNWQAIDASFDKYFSIWLANTDKSSFASTSDFVPYSDLTPVFGPLFIEHGTGAGEQEYIFNTPFQWDGTSNIVVVTLMNAGATDGNASRRAYTHNTGVSNISMFQRKDGSQYTEEQLATITGNTRSTYRANITFIAPCNTDVTCFAPATVTTAITPANVVTVNWTVRTDLRPVVNNFELKYGPAGFDPDNAGVLVPALNNVNTYTINADLDASTDYDVYVRTVCDAANNDYSNWAKSSFTTYPTCWAPVSLAVSATTQTSATLSWDNNELAPTAATRWEVVYGLPGFNPDLATPVETTNNNAYEVTGLNHSTKYEFYVRAKCSATDLSAWSAVATGTTQCGIVQYADMPLEENFDGYTGKTGTALTDHVMPNCWSWLNGGTSYAGLPSIYNSSSNAKSGINSLRFYRYNSTSASYKDQFAILPEFGFNLDTLVVSFAAKFSNVNAVFHLGYMTDPEDSTTFHSIAKVTPSNTSYANYEYSLVDYNIPEDARYLAFVQRKATGSYYVYLDDLTVKLREKINNLDGGTLEICNEFVMPDTATLHGDYNPNLNATYVLRPAEAGQVAHVTGSYDLENGYDFLKLYRGAVNANNLIATYTGEGTIDFVTNSNLWADSGFVSLVFTTDGDNAFKHEGFKLLVRCECPQPNTEPTIDNIEANGTYTWTAGNGRTWTKKSSMDGATDLVEEADYLLKNVAGCDSAYRHLNLTLHPTYEIKENATICERDVYDFFGQQFTTTGTHTVNLQSIYGADSTGILTLQVNTAPTAGIYYNGEAETAVNAFCDNFDMALEARSDVNGATFVWEDKSTAAARVVNPHVADTFTVVATNPATGCTSLPATLTVTTTPVPELTISGDNEICYGQSTTLTVVDSNNLEATYRWSTGATTASITVNPTATTTYTVTATTNNASACAVTAEYTVTVNPLPVIATPTTSVSELCLNESLTLTAESVEGYTYQWNNGATTAVATAVPTATGAFTVTVTDGKGCQKDYATASVTVHPSYELNEERSACVGMLPYTWGAMSLTEAGDYDQHFTIAHGCDSLVHLAFTVQDTTVINSARELCLNTPFTFGEGIYEQAYVATESGVISYVDTTSDECPARYNLNLTVNMPVATSFAESVCDTFTWNNVGYNVTGVYEQTLANAKGCDSVVTLNLTVRESTEGIDNQDVCDQLVWIDGNTYTEPNNMAQFTIKNVAGCDSLVTLNLTNVRHSTAGVDNITYCESFAYTWDRGNGRTYTLSETNGNIRYTFPREVLANAAGCDTTTILNLVMNPVRDTLAWVTDTACDEYQIDTIGCEGLTGTKFIRESGDYLIRTHNDSLSRDEIFRVHLTVLPSTYHTTIAAECLPYTWTIKDANDNDFEIATITAAMVNGASVYNMSVDLAEAGFVSNSCSSIEVLRLTPKYPTTETIEDTICKNGIWRAPAPYDYLIAGEDLNVGENVRIYNAAAGDKNAAGCPLTKEVLLTVNPIYEETMTLELCESEFTYDAVRDLFFDTIYDAKHEGQSIELTYTNNLNENPFENLEDTAYWQTADGCDSTVYITFTVNPTTYAIDTVEACYTYTWDATGTEYKVPGTYTEKDTTLNEYGCMLVTTLQLTLNDTVISYDTISVCTNYEYPEGSGNFYRKDMTFREEAGYSKVTGCDSIRYVTYKVTQNKLNEQYVVSNQPFTWYNGVTYNQSTDNVYYNVTGTGECDSVLLLHFTLVNEVVDLCEGELPYTNPTYGFVLDTNAESGVYTSVDGQGNDTIIAYTIRHNAHESDIRTHVCDSLLWHDSVYTENATATWTGTAANGCDSIVTLMLTVYHSNTSDTTAEACDNFTWYGTEYTASAEPTHTFTNADGCDSVVTLHLTIKYNSDTTMTDSACVTYTWERNGQTYTESGVYAYEYTAANGCASVDSLKLTINQPIVVNETLVVNADSASYRFNGVLYTAPYDGIITVNDTSRVTGCDSTYNLHLIIPFVQQIDTSIVNACGTYTWAANGHTYGWISQSERQSHGFALFKDLTDNRYIYSYPMDTTFVEGAMTAIRMLYLNLMEAEYSTATLTIPVSLGTYDIVGLNDVYTYNFANETVVGTQFYKRDTILMASTGAYCGNYVDYTINLLNNYIIERDSVCADVTTVDWHGEKTLGEVGHTSKFVYKQNEGTLQETVDSLYVYRRPVNNTAIDLVSVCDSTEWHGTWYYANIETPTYTTIDQYGCDSTVTLHLNVKASSHKDTLVTACDNFTWTNHGNTFTYTESGVYTNSYTNDAGCESVDTLKLTINNNSNHGYLLAACDSTQWHGIWYKESGNYNYEYTAENGCPSVDTLHLTINHPASAGYHVNACDSMTWHDTKYTVSGTYYYAYDTEAGCASVDTLYLTVGHATYNAETLTACDSTEWNGTWYKESGDYPYSYTNDDQCASVDTLHLTINVNNTGVMDTVTLCVDEGAEYTWTVNNRSYTTSGDYSAVTTDENGCKATNKLHLTLKYNTSYDSTLYISEGSYRYVNPVTGDTTFYEPGTWVTYEHYTNAESCDSLLSITLNVGTALLGVDQVTSCSQYTWRNGKTYTWLSTEERNAHQNADGESALYYNTTDQEYVYYNPIFNVPQVNAYDSVYVLNLTLTQSTTSQDVVNFPISLGVLTYGDSIFDFSALSSKDFVNTSVEREIHFHSDYYCDSIVDLTINLVNNFVEQPAADICVTQTSFTWRGQTISTATTDYDHAHTYYMYDTIENADSLLTTVEYITVNQHPVVYATERRTACDEYTWNGMLFTESTSNATFDTVDRFGCDSTVTLMLTINKNSSRLFTEQACGSYKWVPTNAADSAVYTVSGEYLSPKYYTNKGCESVDTLRLTVNYKTNSATVADACDSYTWENGDGNTYTTTTFDIDTILYNYWDVDHICQSTDTLYLTIRHNSNQEVTKTACDTYTWTAADKGDGQTYTESGDYTYEYTAENGCPSVNTLHLTINKNSGHAETVTACNVYIWHLLPYEESGDFTFDYVDANNCPSEDTLHLTMNHSTHNVDTAVACNIYIWHLLPYEESGTFTHEYTNDEGCESVDTLKLTIGGGRKAYGVERVTVCGPYTWVVNGDTVATLDESIETSTVVTNPATGCDSTIWLYLTVNPQNVTNEAICKGETFLWTVNNTEYTAAGTYNVPVLDANGNCESEEVLVLTVNDTKSTELTAQVCLGAGYTGYNFVIPADSLAQSGEYTFVKHEQTVNGCDSTVTLTVTVNSIKTGVDTHVACDSYEWIDGNVYTESNTTATYLLDAAGCDSLVTLNLTINHNSSTAYTETVCDGYMWNGTQYTESGDYTYDYTDGNGCASTDTLHLTVNESVINILDTTVCDNIEWHDSVYATSGIYVYNYTTVDNCSGTDYMVLNVNHSFASTIDVTACDHFEWGDGIYIESTTIVDSLTTAAGCDSVTTVNLTVNHTQTDVQIEQACNFYNWHGQTYTESGVYVDTLAQAAVNGCDSIVTLMLTINQPVDTTIEATACGSYEWGDAIYVNSGNYIQHFTTVNGCDSTVTLNLTINNATNNAVTAEACNVYIWHLMPFEETGDYTYEYTNAAGCASVDTLHLTINSGTYNAETAEACNIFIWHLMPYEETGDYTYEYTNANGCASVDTLHLTIKTGVTETVIQEACGFFNWHGETYTESTIATWTGTAANGCDSTVTMYLTINQPADTTVEATACGSYEWGDAIYTTSGNYIQHFTTVNGCDSTVTLNLTINNATNNVEYAEACNIYIWHLLPYEESGVYTHAYTNAAGCASVDTLHLTINSSTYNAETAEACNIFIWHLMPFEESGDYTYSYTNANGCASVDTLHLTITEGVSEVVIQEACSFFNWHGETYTESTIATWTGTAADGCDSTVTMYLTINQPADTTIEATACGSYTWGDAIYTTSGNYIQHFTTVNGCDSTVTLNLTINNPVNTTITAQSCGSYEWGDAIYTASGTYHQTFAAANGCDSAVTLILTINQPVAVTVNETACGSYEWNGAVYNTSGTYVFDTVNMYGCDSTVTLNLTINQPVYETVETSAVESYEWNGVIYTESGTYTYTYTASNGCDSVVTLILTITPADVTVTLLTVNENMGTVSPAGTTTMAPGTVFTATATANDGYHFVAWYDGDDSVSYDAEYTFVVNENITLTAIFAADPMVYYTISAVPNDPTMGMVLGAGEYEAGATVTLIARPRSGYRFISWNDGVTDSVRTFIAVEDVDLVANFSTVGIDDIDADNVNIFAVDNKIVVKGAENHNIYIYDVNGRCVRHQATVTNETIEFTMTATGVYLVKVGTLPAKRVVVLR